MKGYVFESEKGNFLTRDLFWYPHEDIKNAFVHPKENLHAILETSEQEWEEKVVKIHLADGSNVVRVNGNVSGSTIISGRNGITINGQRIDVSGSTIEIKLDGDCASIKADGNVTVTGNVKGNIDAGGSVNCGNVGGNVDAGGSVKCGNVSGDVDAGGSVSMRK